MTYHIIVNECEDGKTKCDGFNLVKCIDGEWQLIEENSPECTPEIPDLTGLLPVAVLVGAAGLGLYILTR